MQKPAVSKYILFSIMILSVLIICSCSKSLYTSYYGGSSKKAPKCSAGTYSTHALYIYKR